MKFNVYFKISGPGGEMEAPAKNNPHHAESMGDCLEMLSKTFPELTSIDITITGVRVEIAEEYRRLSGGGDTEGL